ncbi:hypothetical protein [Ascidiimonas aurantiaca]|uniref:hypothetical protein n=1 Tax=Ascidiimonas aurantiaca TaxID=1685432 RepID=UPI0030EDDAAC
MKKKQIKKLSLQKTRISDLKQNNARGGLDFSLDCPTVVETICFTFCFPNKPCNIFQTNEDCH